MNKTQGLEWTNLPDQSHLRLPVPTIRGRQLTVVAGSHLDYQVNAATKYLVTVQQMSGKNESVNGTHLRCFFPEYGSKRFDMSNRESRRLNERASCVRLQAPFGRNCLPIFDAVQERQIGNWWYKKGKERRTWC